MVLIYLIKTWKSQIFEHKMLNLYVKQYFNKYEQDN